MSSRVIIIGSGISGLTAAALLNRKGYEVTILEKKKQAGGAIQRFRRKNAEFDVGFHYTGGLGERGILRALWRGMGILDSLCILPFPADGADHIQVYGSGIKARAFFSYPGIIEELISLFPREREGIEQFFRIIKERGEAIPFYSLQGPLTPFLAPLTFFEKKTLGDLIRSCTSEPALQAILCLPVCLHGVAPDEVGITMHTSVAHSVYSGMYTIDGGGRALADTFLQSLQDKGVVIQTNAEIEKIITRNDRVAGVQTADSVLETDQVIFTGHPLFLTDLVPEKIFKKAFISRLQRLKNTDSMFIVFGAMAEADPAPETIWNNYYGISAGLEILDILHYNGYPPFFLSNCGVRDSSLPGRQDVNRAMTLMRPASWQEVEHFDRGKGEKRAAGYRAWKQLETEKLLQAATAAWPEIANNFKVITASSPLTFRDELNYPQGAIYGISRCQDQFSIGVRTRLPGLWLSGQNTLMPGIIGASLAGLITVGHMIGLEALWQEVRSWA